MTERVLPHSLDAERSVLGACLVNKQALDLVSDWLTPVMFFRDAHRWIYEAELGLYRKGQPVDPLLLRTALADAGKLEECGGLAYLATLADGMPSSTNVEHYAAIVRDKATARDVIAAANRLLVSAYAGDLEPSALVSLAEEELLAVSERAVPGDLVTASDLVKVMWPIVEDLMQRKRKVAGLSTGFRMLDGFTRGMAPGQLWVLGGRPSEGKSTLALDIAVHAATDQWVAFFSVEMAKEEQGFRILSGLGHLDGHRLQNGWLGREEQDRLGNAFAAMGELKLAIDESPGLTVMQIRSRCRRMKARHGLGLVVIDYLTLLDHGPQQRSDNHTLAIGRTTRALKRLARELQVPVLLLCQLNRSVEGRQDNKPRLSDLRDSGAIEQDADVVLLVYRLPEQAGTATNELLIAKQRNGPKGEIPMTLIGDQFRFVEVIEQEARA